jgi:hypothetical protein
MLDEMTTTKPATSASSAKVEPLAVPQGPHAEILVSDSRVSIMSYPRLCGQHGSWIATSERCCNLRRYPAAC